MVVSRPTPVAPAASRTNSSQPIPRAAKGKAPQTGLSVASDSISARDYETQSQSNGGAGKDASDAKSNKDPVTPSQKASKQKSKHKRKKRTTQAGSISTIIALLTRLVFLVTTIYGLLACPDSPLLSYIFQSTTPSPPSHASSTYSDIPHTLPTVRLPLPTPHPLICHHIRTTHHYFIQPTNAYILSPLRSTVQAALKHPAVQPYTETTQQFVSVYVAPVLSYVWSKSVFAIDKVVMPSFNVMQREWYKRVVPRYHRYILPAWDKHVVSRYNAYIVAPLRPYIRAGVRTYDTYIFPPLSFLSRWSSKAYHRTAPYISRLQYFLQTSFQFLSRHLHRTWLIIKPRLAVLLQRIAANMTLLGKWIVGQRREYVDPHVMRIWEKVTELSKNRASESSSAGAEFSAKHTVQVPVEKEHGAIASSINDPITSAVEESLFVSSPSLSTKPEATPSLDAFISSAPLVEIPLSTHDELSNFRMPTSSDTVSMEPSATVTPVMDDINLASFYAELGIDPDFPPESSGQVAPEPSETLPPQPLQEKPSEEERLAEVAAKRREITSRHTVWEQRLSDLVKDKKKALRKALVALRRSAVQEMGLENGEIRGLVRSLGEEGGRLIKGVEGVVRGVQHKSMKHENKDQQDASWGKERAMYDAVVRKVEDKFENKIKEVEERVHQWYLGVRENEINEVLQASNEVRNLVETAQADIGLDYAWLDDVTYQDWQRYHDLMRTSENFTDAVRSIQNGTHPSPPIDPLLPALDELQTEVQEIVDGFQTKLRHIKRTAEQFFDFGTVNESEHGSDDHTDYTDDVPGAAEKDFRVDHKPEPPVSIIPISSDGQASDNGHDGDRDADIPPVLLGRSQEEVLQALERADAATGVKQSDIPLVKSGVNATKDQAPNAAPVHMEL